MNIEKFTDAFGDDLFALALMVTKDFDSASEIFARVAVNCDKLSENAGMFEIAKAAFPQCRKARCNDNAETLSGIGLSKKQEALVSELFFKPQISRAIIHLCYENDLSADQIAEVTGESGRYVSEQLSEISGELSGQLENHYKELCLKIASGDELKTKVIQAVKTGEKRLFEVGGEAVPQHSWTKKQKIAAVVLAIVTTIMVCIVIPLFLAYLNSADEMNSSYDEAPIELTPSYTAGTEHTPSD